MPNSSKSTTIFIWIITVVITLLSVVYQRMTGPTYPVSGKITLQNTSVKYQLLRSHDTTSDALIKLKVPDEQVTGEMRWRHYPSNESWKTDSLAREGEFLVSRIAKEPAAGKVMYQIALIDRQGEKHFLTEKPVIIRFKGHVPIFILIPHIFFIFLAMLLGTRTGIEAILKREKTYRYALITTVLFFIGGLILGPIVQKYAFDAYWTGWPFGHDLTDNKVAVSFLLWLIALWKGRGENAGRGWFIAAAVVQLVIFLIPHSVLGSEIDYTQVK